MVAGYSNRKWFYGRIHQHRIAGKKEFSGDGKNGFEIIFRDPGFYYQEWSSAAEGGEQSDSSFEIIQFDEMETGNQSTLYKYIAEFNCTVYRKWSRVIQLENGVMVGYITVQ